MHPHHAVQPEQHAGHGGTDHGGERDGGHEQPDDPRPFGGREPQGEIEDNPGEEPGLGKAQQHAHEVEAVFAGNERHGAGQDSPADHDASDPFAGAELFQEQVGGNLKDEIREEEDAGAEPERGLRQAEVLAHGERGEAHVHPVQVGDEVAQHQERHEPHGDPPDCPAFQTHFDIPPRAANRVVIGGNVTEAAAAEKPISGDRQPIQQRSARIGGRRGISGEAPAPARPCSCGYGP